MFVVIAAWKVSDAFYLSWLIPDKNSYLHEELSYAFICSHLHVRQGLWEFCEKQHIVCEDFLLKQRTRGLMTGVNSAAQESLVLEFVLSSSLK